MAEVINFSNRHKLFLIHITMLGTSLVNINLNQNTDSQKWPSKHYNALITK
jgi:hypothetical protein